MHATLSPKTNARRLTLFAAAALAMCGTTARADVEGLPGSSFQLTASAGYVSTPDGASIYSWGYGAGGNMQFPGPTLIVNEGDSVRVTLTNQLPPAAGNVSIVFQGHDAVATDGVSGLLTREAPPGGSVTYTFTASKAGTYLYSSGTRPDLQVEMGLSGALIVRPSNAQCAYDNPNTCFDRENLYVLSEMDLDVHRAVEEQVSGHGPIAVSTSPYDPEYWFINGRCAPDTMAESGTGVLAHQPYNAITTMFPGERLLLRVVGAGRAMHPFHTHGNHSRVLARDGQLMAKDPTGELMGPLVFTITSIPGSTTDAIFEWTGKDLGWDIYGSPHVLGPDSCNAGPDGYDTTTHEWCADHGKKIPVLLPELQQADLRRLLERQPVPGRPRQPASRRGRPQPQRRLHLHVALAHGAGDRQQRHLPRWNDDDARDRGASMSGPRGERSTTMHKILRRTLHTFALTLAASLAAGAASAATVPVYLRATRTTKTLPGGVVVPVWAYAQCTSNTFSSCGEATVPGPALTANVGDTLSITVRNTLVPQTSVVIPGQSGSGAPTMDGGTPARVRSFTRETLSGGTRTYTWTPLKAGTYLYQSGTRPSIQVPMGLYGALVVNAPATYPGAAYTTDRLLLFSEIDAVQNAAVNGAAGEAAYPSTIDYNPKYFLLNGTAFDAASPGSSTVAIPAAGSVLVRLANAGLRTHVATIVGLDLDVRAEDGNLYPTPRQLSAVPLPAGKTHDALATLADARTYAVYDRMLDLTNADAPDGGMLAFLQVGAGSPVVGGGASATNDSYQVAEDTALVQATPGVLGNDSGLGNAAVVLSPSHGSLTLNANGAFTYTPEPDYAGPDAFVYSATGGGATSTATALITVTAANDAPVAREDAYSNTFGASLTVPAPGVLANDGDPEGDAMTAVLAAAVPGLTLDSNGSISYSGASGLTTFQYQARDASGALSAPVSVTLDMKPVRGLALNVLGVEPSGTANPVADYRWLVEEDANFYPDPAHPELPSLGTNFHRSHMPVVAQGCAGAGCSTPPIAELALDPAKHYYVSVLPRSAGSGVGFTNGGAAIPPAAVGPQPPVSVYVHRQPLPPAQMSILVFEDSAPTNGAPDGNEQGLGGFEIIVDDGGGRYGMNGGRMLVDKDGNLLTNAKAGTPGCPVSVASRPGVILDLPRRYGDHPQPRARQVRHLRRAAGRHALGPDHHDRGHQGQRRVGEAERTGVLPGVRASGVPRVPGLREPRPAGEALGRQQHRHGHRDEPAHGTPARPDAVRRRDERRPQAHDGVGRPQQRQRNRREHRGRQGRR